MTFMRRSFRVILALGFAIGMTGIYLTGPDPDTCFNCENNANPIMAVAIFVVTTLICLRVFKRIGDFEREHGW